MQTLLPDHLEDSHLICMSSLFPIFCHCLGLSGSHRRQNRNGSSNHRHVALLDLKEHADFSHRRPTSQDFCRDFSGIFL